MTVGQLSSTIIDAPPKFADYIQHRIYKKFNMT